MPVFRNVRQQCQSRHSGRLENRVPVGYDREGWQIPLGGHATLQDLYLTRGPSQGDAPAPAPSRTSHPLPLSDREGALSSPPSHRTTTVDLAANGNPSLQSRARSFSASSSRSASTTSSSSSTSAFAAAATAAPVSSERHMGAIRHAPYQRRNSHSRRPAEGHIPRPRNAFIIFRSWYNQNHPPAQAADGAKTNQNEVSRQAGRVWKSMSEREKAPFVRQSKEEVEEHHQRYPNYVYAPGGKKPAASRSRPRPQQPQQQERRQKPVRARGAEMKEEGLGVGDDDGSCFELREAVPVVPALSERSLRPRLRRRYVSFTPSPSISSTPSPSRSITSRSSSEPDAFKQEQQEEVEFVPTEDIPDLDLPPSLVPAQAKKEEMSCIDLSLRPPNMDSDLDEAFGVKAHALLSAQDAFLFPEYSSYMIADELDYQFGLFSASSSSYSPATPSMAVPLHMWRQVGSPLENPTDPWNAHASVHQVSAEDYSILGMPMHPLFSPEEPVNLDDFMAEYTNIAGLYADSPANASPLSA